MLIRRLYLDLLGVPPTPEAIVSFVNDPRPDAYERLVERLLADPRHGERYARHWLDVARWAESEGYESNHPRPFAWRYRDWVVRAINRDLPWRDFVRAQLAGDEIKPFSDDNLIATGFLAAARISSNEEDKWRQRNDMLVDVVNATGSAFLGLTIHCAQCHNHKFEAISARDYYRLMGFFLKGQPVQAVLRDPATVQRWQATRPADYEKTLERWQQLQETGRARHRAEVKKSLSAETLKALAIPADRRTEEQEALVRQADLQFQATPQRIERYLEGEERKIYNALKQKLEAWEKAGVFMPQTYAWYSPATSAVRLRVLPEKGFYPLPLEPEELLRARPWLLQGGEVHQRTVPLETGWPSLFGPTPAAVAKSSSRLALAEWLADSRHPLAARVWVNRLWQWHFGRGLVGSPNDFGVKGQPPTHPELLNWLAAEFLRAGGSSRHIHRLILTSATYRQSSTPASENRRKDSDNRYLARWLPRRLEAEPLRDAMLAVTGELEYRPGGPSDADERTSRRRGLYLFQKRERPPELQGLFDGPSAATESCPQRHVTTVPLQPLYLLNSVFAQERGQALARRLRQMAGDDRQKMVAAAFWLILGREIEPGETQAVRRFFARDTSEQALERFCQALLNLNEFAYIP